MKCSKCGAEIQEGTRYCIFCGAENRLYEDKQNNINLNMTRQELYERYVSHKSKNWVTAFGVLCFINAFFSMIYASRGNLLSYIDLILYLAGGIMIFAMKNPGVSVCMTVLAVFGCLINMAYGQVTGILVIISGICASKTLCRFSKAYRQYMADGSVPDKEI